MGVPGDGQPEPPLSALRRLALAAVGTDLRTAEVVVWHATIEREVNLALSKLVPNPERLGGLNLVHSLKMLAALWTTSPSAPLATLLTRWDELRNHMAHGHPAAEAEQHLKRLKDAALAMGVQGVAENSITIAGLAAFTCHLLSTGGCHEGLVHLLQMPLGAFTKDGQPLVATLEDDTGELARVTISPSGNTIINAPRDGNGSCALNLHFSNGDVQPTSMNTSTISRNDTIVLTMLSELNPENVELLTIK